MGDATQQEREPEPIDDRTLEELNSLVVSTLETNGVLGQIRAQLRSHVYKAIDHEEQASRDSASKLLRFQEGRLMAELVREFLEFYNLRPSLSVFLPESGLGREGRPREAVGLDAGLSRVARGQSVLEQVMELAAGPEEARRGDGCPPHAGASAAAPAPTAAAARLAGGSAAGRLEGGAAEAAAVGERRKPLGTALAPLSAAALAGPGLQVSDPLSPVKAPPSAAVIAQDADGRARQAVAAGPTDLSGGPGRIRRPGRAGTSPPQSSSGGSVASPTQSVVPSPLAASTPSPASHEASPEASPAASNRSAGSQASQPSQAASNAVSARSACSHSSRPSQNSRASEPVRSIHSGSDRSWQRVPATTSPAERSDASSASAPRGGAGAGLGGAQYGGGRGVLSAVDGAGEESISMTDSGGEDLELVGHAGAAAARSASGESGDGRSPIRGATRVAAGRAAAEEADELQSIEEDLSAHSSFEGYTESDPNRSGLEEASCE